MEENINIAEILSIDDLPNEIWKDIPEYKGFYQVSNLGRVKSLKRFFDTERSLWYLDCVHRSKSFLKRREKKFLKQGIKTMISKWYGF